MPYTIVAFHVALYDKANFAEVAERINQALDCAFVVPDDLVEINGINTELVGLNLKLWCLETAEARKYILSATAIEPIQTKWEGIRGLLAKKILNINEFILTVLHERDSEGWYILAFEEMAADLDRLIELKTIE